MRRLRLAPSLLLAALLVLPAEATATAGGHGERSAVALQEPSGGPERAGTPAERPNREGADARSAGALSEAELDRLTAEVADQLRCPVCRNQSVLESSSQLAREMQGVIRDRLAAGESPEEVRAYFVRSYGDWILLQPEPEGFNLIVYALPAAVLLAGVVVVVFLIRRWSGRSRPAAASGTPHGTGGPRVRDEPDCEAPSAASPFSAEEERWLREALRER